MCGITGYWDSQQGHNPEHQAALKRMTRSLAHRGPDDEGYFIDHQLGLALGHRRLSILDLSPHGRQPMTSASGRYVIVFNGEVYNHRELRDELAPEGANFHGRSDTEVMLAAIDRWGLIKAVSRFNGMFAFALWDRQLQVLALVRDRLGVKPLYYGWVRSAFVFGSELKSLRAFPGFDNATSHDSLTLLLRYNFIPAPYSMYQGIYKVMPGTMLLMGYGDVSRPSSPIQLRERTVAYWSAKDVAQFGCTNRFPGTVDEAVTELDRLLKDAVALRMEADVPVGAFLSGGVDSSSVVALMQAESARPVKTFSIAFKEAEYNEAGFAHGVARYLGTDHAELCIQPKDALAVIPKLPTMYDEPFADSSQIPTFLISQFSAGSVKVVLSGDGGDELFAGYNRYKFASQYFRHIRSFPLWFRRAVARSIRGYPRLWKTMLERTIPLIGERMQRENPRGKLELLSDTLIHGSVRSLYEQLVSHWEAPEIVVPRGSEPLTALTDSAQQPTLHDDVEYMMLLDQISYLPDDILTKVDRASMAVGLEARVPLLDYRVVEFAWRLPACLKIVGGQPKWLLRQTLYQYVPKALIERPKQGFRVPIAEWLRGPLREWAETLLDERRLRQEGYFDPGIVQHTWADHLSGRSNEHSRLWGVLMFQAWLEQQSSGVTTL